MTYPFRPCIFGPELCPSSGEKYCPKGHDRTEDVDWDEWCEKCRVEYLTWGDMEYDLSKDEERE